MTLALCEIGSELVRGRNQYACNRDEADPDRCVPGSRADRPSNWRRCARPCASGSKQGRAWASEPLPAIAAAPPTEALPIPASERGTPEPDAAFRGLTPGSGRPPPSTEAPWIQASEPGTPHPSSAWTSAPRSRTRRRSRRMSTTAERRRSAQPGRHDFRLGHWVRQGRQSRRTRLIFFRLRKAIAVEVERAQRLWTSRRR